jgi:diketogulonate reductase-like aldo/keto reductase
MLTFTTATGLVMPRLGQGTWNMGVRRGDRGSEVEALRLGLELGMTLIDTAEMYADGGAEEVVGEAIQRRRDQVFLVSKVLPSNASRRGTVQACERSLRRLRTEFLDHYLLHWPGSHPLRDTLAAFVELREAGKIKSFGVSNFDQQELERALAMPGGSDIAANQVLYNLSRRGIERNLLPWCEQRRIAVMAYSPLEQARLPDRGAIADVAARHQMTPAQVALAWTLRLPHLVSLPKASRLEHVRANAAARDLILDDEDLAALDRQFAPPTRDVPLEML